MESTLRFLSFMAVDGADLSRALCVGGMSTLTASGSAEVFTSTLVTQIPEPPLGRAPIAWNWKVPSTPPGGNHGEPGTEDGRTAVDLRQPVLECLRRLRQGESPWRDVAHTVGEKLDDGRVENGADQDPFDFRRGGRAHDDRDRLAQDWFSTRNGLFTETTKPALGPARTPCAISRAVAGDSRMEMVASGSFGHLQAIDSGLHDMGKTVR